MADDDSIPRGLTKRGDTWHIDRLIDGQRVRVTTGCTDLENAKAVYGRIEERLLFASHARWWTNQIERTRRGKSSWLNRAVSAALSRARSRKREGIECALTIEHMLALAEGSGGRCCVSGMAFSDAVHGVRRPFYPSLDRIDCSRGYFVDNCRLVCAIVNYAMSDFGEAAFRIIARATVANELLRDMPPTCHRKSVELAP